MKSKSAYLIINPRAGKKIDKLAALISVLSAAGWKTDTAIKEFGGQTQKLARKAAEAGYDLVIAFGGDGTLNQVVNGVMAAKRRRCIVGVIPGGTANVWAHEIGISEDPIKASLALANSQGRRVDLGHVQVDSLPLARQTSNRPSKRPRLASGGRHHFLLMAGLGLDAAIMRRVSTPLKEKVGEAAVALAAVEEIPAQHTFPIEIRASGHGRKKAVRWKGEALQVIVGNTRRYGNITEVTPEAHIDDGVLDVCVITAGDPLSTMQQIISVLLRRDPVHGRSEYFQSAHVEISVPASVDLQLDGSRVKRKDCLAAPSRAARKPADDRQTDVVTYYFDAMPRALPVAIPRTYGGALFEEEARSTSAPVTEKEHQDPVAVRTETRKSGNAPHQSADQIDALLEHGRKVTVIGVGPSAERKGTWIVAGEASANNTGKSKPVAVRIDRATALVGPTGTPLPTTAAAKLPEGHVIVVDGKPNKRGVIRAKYVVVDT